MTAYCRVEPFGQAFQLATPVGPCVGIALPPSGRYGEAQSRLLHPRERAHAEGLPDGRARTYVGGRLAIREAFRQAGLAEPGAILTGEGGEPQLPPGTAGSISHKEHLAVAVASGREGIDTLGIDVETTAPGLIDIGRRVLRPEEIAALDHLPEAARLSQTRRIFSAKEAVYKAGYPLCRRFFGFHDALMTVPLADIEGLFHTIVTRLVPSDWDPTFEVRVVQYAMSNVILSLASGHETKRIRKETTGCTDLNP